MNEDNWYQDSDDYNAPDDEAAYAPKPGMSTGMKVFIGIMIVGGATALLCCGGAFFFFRNMFQITDDPAEIQKIQEEIAGIEIPEGLEAEGGVTMDMGMVGVQMKMAIYQGDKSALMLMQMVGPGQMSEQQMRDQFRQSMQQQGQDSDIKIESAEERVLTVNGEEATFEFVKGTTAEGDAVRQVSGMFAGRGGTAFLLYHVPEKDWNEEQVVQMIESIQK